MTPHLRTNRTIHGRVPRIDTPVAYRVPKPEVPDASWQDRAACRDEDRELFFPIGNTGPALLQIEDAKAVCRRCDVADRCLLWALDTGQDHGVWGGMSETERRVLKRRVARAESRNRARAEKQSAA